MFYFGIFFLLGSLNAQVITVTPNPMVANFEGVVLDGSVDLESHVSVTNNTTDSISLKWQREIPVDCPEGWKTLICDNVTCYGANTGTNYNPPAIQVPFVLAPGETYSNFLLHVRPGTSAGCCQVNIHFSTIENPDEILETAIYDVHVNDPNCAISSTEEPSFLNALQAYPNPTTGQFRITDNPLVKTVTVYNLFGKQVCSFEHMNNKTHDISGAPNGLYLVTMLDENGEVLKTARINKHDVQP